MKDYKTVKQSAEATYVVERSKFIAHVERVESREQAEQFIAKIKKEYWDARHNVSAYVLKGGETRCSDDGEPSGTSGMPTLDVITKQGFSDVCIVTTRYFGGILLGTGGLVRAYSKAAAMALEAAGSVQVDECCVFESTLPYAYIDKFTRFLLDNGCVTEHTEYAESVCFRYYLRAGEREQFLSKLTDHFHGEVQAKLLENDYKVFE
ncbi:MAG: YigZ family protein [Clostridia bacterium]|nr:YigZ family protein [Clostridia bacterium]